MNQIIINNTILWLEGFFHFYPNIDSFGIQFPNIQHYKKLVPLDNVYIKVIKFIEKSLPSEYKYKSKNKIKCIFCKKVTNTILGFQNIIWTKMYLHQITKHNIIPSLNFMNFIIKLQNCLINYKNCDIKKFNIFNLLNLRISIFHNHNDIKYVRLTTNQLNIMDALMYYGGQHAK